MSEVLRAAEIDRLRARVAELEAALAAAGAVRVEEES